MQDATSQEVKQTNQHHEEDATSQHSSITVDQITQRVVQLLTELPGSVVDWKLTYNFVLEYFIMCMRLRNNTRAINPTIVYHWTHSTYFNSIVHGGLQVPDGHNVAHKTDVGFYGKGIYTSPCPTYAKAYGNSNRVFVCLALPGRQYHAHYPADLGCSLKPHYDSHISSDRQNKEWVFFKTEQLLNCYLVDYSLLTNSQKYQQQVELIAIYLRRKWEKYGKQIIMQSMKNNSNRNV